MGCEFMWKLGLQAETVAYLWA